jgi:ribosomal-protein-alanine acetyltransferase
MIKKNPDSKSHFRATNLPMCSSGYSSKITPANGGSTRPSGSKAGGAHSDFSASQTLPQSNHRSSSSPHTGLAGTTPAFQSYAALAGKAVPAFEVRSARTKDANSIINIHRDAFKEPWPEEYYRRKSYWGGHTTLVVEGARPGTGSKHVAGFIDYQLANKKIFLFLETNEKNVHIRQLATAAENRRKGIGRSLMMECIERGRQEDATSVNLEVRKSNKPAIHLYESLGFKPTGIHQRYYRDGEDAILMNLKLK